MLLLRLQSAPVMRGPAIVPHFGGGCATAVTTSRLESAMTPKAESSQQQSRIAEEWSHHPKRIEEHSEMKNETDFPVGRECYDRNPFVADPVSGECGRENNFQRMYSFKELLPTLRCNLLVSKDFDCSSITLLRAKHYY